MATSRLTGRTLALATVALVLACGKAVLGEPGRSSQPARPPTFGSSPAGRAVVGAASGVSSGSHIGTIGGSRSGTSTRGERRPLIVKAGSIPAQRGAVLASAIQQRPSAEPTGPVRRIVITDAMMAQNTTPGRARQMASRAAPRATPVALARKPMPMRLAQAETPASRVVPTDPRLAAALRTAPPAPALTKNAFSLGAQAIGQISPP